jgi:hypothetical protein
MKMRNRNHKILVFGCLLLCLTTGGFPVMPTRVLAAEKTDSKEEMSLTIRCEYDNQPLVGETISLYKVAEDPNNGEASVTKEFQDYKVDYTELDNGNEENLALVLADYAERDHVKPYYSGNTDTTGTLEVDEEDGLTSGWYLVVEDRLIIDKIAYTSEPFMVALPATEEDGTIEYEVQLNPKVRSTDTTETVKMQALIIWDDENSDENRPESVTVQLLKDGEVYDEQELSEENNWSYTWENLDGTPQWTVVQKDVLECYTISVERNGESYIVLNKYTGTQPNQSEIQSVETPQEEPTEEKSTKSTTQTTTESTSDSSEKSTSSPDNNSSAKLPQTGLLWWPVPVLLISGMLLIIVGLLRHQKGGEEDEE